MALQALAQVAVDAVVKASCVCEAVRTGGLLQAIDKADKSPVTVADYAAQAVVIAELAKHFEYPVVGEEDAATLRADDGALLRAKVLEAVRSVDTDMTEQQVLDAIDKGNHDGGATGRFWALDPIDGTKGFLRNDQYAVALGLIDDGKVVLGVLGCPNLPLDWKNPNGERGCGFVATKGGGCFRFPLARPHDREPAKVSALAESKDGRMVESVESGHTAHDLSSLASTELGLDSEASVRMDSQAKYGALARGDAEVYLRLPKPGKRYEEKIWDHAAGVVVVEEAGGAVTDINGKPLDFSVGRTLKENTGVVGSNGTFHNDIIAALAKHTSKE